MTGQDVEVGISVEYRYTGVDGDGGDEAVDQLANGLAFPATCTVQRRGVVVAGRLRRQHRRKREQSPECLEVPLVTGAGEHFHPNRVADGYLFFE